MRPHWLAVLVLLAPGCSESPQPDCAGLDYAICGTPLAEVDEHGSPWLSYSQDQIEICQEPSYIETSLGYCEDGKRVLTRSWGFGGDQRFYSGETLVGRMAGGDVLFIDTASPQCLCAGGSFQGTLDSVHCRVTMAEELCGRSGPSWIEDVTLQFKPIESPPECACAGFRLSNGSW